MATTKMNIGVRCSGVFLEQCYRTPSALFVRRLRRRNPAGHRKLRIAGGPGRSPAAEATDGRRRPHHPHRGHKCGFNWMSADYSPGGRPSGAMRSKIPALFGRRVVTAAPKDV
jgi:hypothetical protein